MTIHLPGAQHLSGLRQGHHGLLESLARETVADWPGAAFEVKIEESYRNTREILDDLPEVVDNAREAIRRVGVEPHTRPIRGGTDGSKLSFMGLPPPNIFAESRASIRASSGCPRKT